MNMTKWLEDSILQSSSTEQSKLKQNRYNNRTLIYGQNYFIIHMLHEEYNLTQEIKDHEKCGFTKKNKKLKRWVLLFKNSLSLEEILSVVAFCFPSLILLSTKFKFLKKNFIEHLPHLIKENNFS